MQTLSPGIAVGFPEKSAGFDHTSAQIAAVRNGDGYVDVRVGVGPLRTALPARVLSYAKILAGTYNSDLRKVIGTAPTTMTVFSSAGKGPDGVQMNDVTAIAAVADAFRRNGVNEPISIELASPNAEVPSRFTNGAPAQLVDWVLVRDVSNNPDRQPSMQYALDHAASTMFGDLLHTDFDRLVVTLGGATEGRFWAMRSHVRQAALDEGLRVAPAIALINKSIRRPWYTPTDMEPQLSDAVEPERALRQLERAANPKSGGNAGLKPEARAFKGLVGENWLPDFVAQHATASGTLEFLMESDVEMGPRLTEFIQFGGMRS